MKRFIAAMFLVLVVVIVILIIVVSQRGYSPRDTALSRYLVYFNPIAHGVSVSTIVRASHPAKFTPEMSGPVVGNSAYYQTDVKYATNDSNGGARALPYPSNDLSCVLLTGSSGQQWIVFVVLHEDMYNADWLVHEARTTWPSDELRGILDTIGCSDVVKP